MSLEKLESLRGSGPSSPKAGGPRRLPAALLPIGLVFAFLAVFGLMFGSRLLPAQEVKTAPVIILRTSGDLGSESPESQPQPSSAQLLFQASGWVEPDPYITNVPSLVNGVVREVLVLEGHAVKKGDILATLIDDDAKLDVQEAERTIATLDATQVAHCAQLPVLNAEMHAIQQRIAAQSALHAELEDKAQRLAAVRKGSVPEQDVKQAQLKVDGQQAVIEEANAELAGIIAKINKVDLERLTVVARISAAQTALARKQLALERTTIKASMDGMVLRLHAAPGKKRMLEGNEATSALIVELYDPAKLQARIDIPLTEAAGLRIGQPVKITTDLLPDAKFDAEVTRIVGEADLQRNTLQAKVRILKPDLRLRPEMLVRAEFYPGGTSTHSHSSHSPSHRNQRLSIYAPKAALLNQSGTTAQAWVIEDHRAQRRDLKIGTEERDNHLHVLDGLRPGDQLILPPHDKLKEGSRVRAKNQVPR
jgi:HlyD family secretion protein